MKKLPGKIVAAVLAILICFAIIELAVKPQKKTEESDNNSSQSVSVIISNADNLQTFEALLKTAGLKDSLNTKQAYTVFAPIDTAFTLLPENSYAHLMAAQHKAQLARVVQHHMVQGRIAPRDLKDSLLLQTVAGDSLRITIRHDSTFVDGMPIVGQKMQAPNGVVYLIGRVLMPKSDGDN